MCQDPANYKFLDVIAIPMLYPEDEEEYSVQLSALIGKQHRNLTRVVDFSIHLARNFSFTGFSAVSERMAITILERYDGPNMLEYMKERWNYINNTDFRMLLCQIMNGLIGLHEEGIVHRNLGPTCIIVELPAGMRRVKGGMAGAKSENIKEVAERVDDKGAGAANLIATYKKSNARLGEYWFLFNPRKAGCGYSQGRSDWGNRITVPPECSSGKPITEKSDVYAFGVCVFIWATADAGKTFPDMMFTRIDQLKEMIPLKWGAWVYTLLRMCLEKDPAKRAGSKEVLSFLSSRTIEKLK
jgi:serine/threonine protein kinase